ncbi:hypothetical protein SSX86_000700 [Deinandra increscens subsp. villosa]|uniref:Uncharacterized protein n=1 Tax=Deinandra increscens subsp. villosa TaxID=3103831 RepID=A0AAP0DPX2_9ASTR
MDGEEKMPEKKPLNANNLMKFAYGLLTEYEAMRMFQATLQEMHDCLGAEEDKKGFFKKSRTHKDKPPVTRETLLPYAGKPEWETVSHFKIKRDTLRRKARQLDIQLQWDSKSASSAAAGTSRSSVGTTKFVAANDKKKGIKKEESSLLSESATGPPKKKGKKKQKKKHSKSKAAKKKGKKRRKKKHSKSKDAKKKGKMEEKEESESSSSESESSSSEPESSSYESDSSSYESDSSSSESEAPKKKGKKRRKKRHSKSKAAKKKKRRIVKANEAPNELRFLVECLVPEKQTTFSITLRKEEWKLESLMLKASTSADMVPGKFVLIYKGRDGALFSLENSASMEACVNMALESGGEEVALRLVKS